MRDRLIDLHHEAGVEWDYYLDECINNGETPSKTYDEFHADYLLANGVIVPPCKVGDRYVMDTAKTIFNAWNDVTGALVEGTSWYYELESVIEDIVKLSFGAGVLYKEEAEAKLRERSGEDVNL